MYEEYTIDSLTFAYQRLFEKPLFIAGAVVGSSENVFEVSHQ